MSFLILIENLLEKVLMLCMLAILLNLELLFFHQWHVFAPQASW